MRLRRARVRRARAPQSCGLGAGLALLDALGAADPRPAVRGKFLVVGEQKFTARGVTYGPFRPDESGCTYHNPDIVRRDFQAMSAHGINAVRTYTCPPRWLLDLAMEHRLHVMVGVGLAGEQLTTFLNDRSTTDQIRRRCVEEVRACSGHPALLAYSIGNEIPGTIVRWHGHRRVEHFLRELYEIVREHDPSALITYVNYPTTEYLDLPFLDFLSFNVYLESPERFEAYLARLHNIADQKPLVMAEIGLDSLRMGMDAQAEGINWQIRGALASGCAGIFVFSWTDEWHTGGVDVNDWKFGITDAQRRPKPALHVVGRAFVDAPRWSSPSPPRVSVVVCTHNGSRTIRECLEGCANLNYPNYEVIVVNDGSTDQTAEIVRGFGIRLINVPNGGLSRARNLGLHAATGEIIAYLDDDARPDEHWLRYLAETFATTDHVGVGGPNIVPSNDPPFSHCVANAPGGPTHVLLTDSQAEHIPGCNMSFRVRNLREVGGFDEQFRIAGDDVDICWTLQSRGWTLGFHPAAIVWHHRRPTLGGYWRQQLNYGRAEAMLENKWPEKYNAIGHVGWRGRLYGGGTWCGIGLKSRIYHGVWASSPFQSRCAQDWTYAAAPLMPEWYLVIGAMLALGLIGLLWPPLLLCLPLAGLAACATAVQSLRCAWRASLPATSVGQLKLRLVTAALHMIQPSARLWGRVSYGLSPWRRQMPRCFRLPMARTHQIWSERWQAAESRLALLEAMLKGQHVPLRRGGAYDTWDLEVRGGFFAAARVRMGIEQYPCGRQYVCFRAWPHFFTLACALATIPAALAVGAAVAHSWLAASLLAALGGLLLLRACGDCGAAMSCLAAVFDRFRTRVQCETVTKPAPSAAPAEQIDEMKERGAEDFRLTVAVNGGLTGPLVPRIPWVRSSKQPSLVSGASVLSSHDQSGRVEHLEQHRSGPNLSSVPSATDAT